MVKSRVTGVVGVGETKGLEVDHGGDLGLRGLRTDSAILMEGIIGPESRLVGRSLKQINFRQKFGVLILAVHRRGVNLRERFEDVELAFGDTLLVEGPVQRMNELFTERDFINLSKPAERPLRRNKAPIAMLAIMAFMVLGALEVAPLVTLAMGRYC